MAENNVFRRAIKASGDLARSGDPQQALKVVDDVLPEALQKNRLDWISLLSGHAVIVCRSIGDLSRARYYCEYCLAHVPDEPRALCDLADVLFQQGEADLAKRHAAKSYALVAHSNNKEAQRLVELLTKKWPEIADW